MNFCGVRSSQLTEGGREKSSDYEQTRSRHGCRRIFGRELGTVRNGTRLVGFIVWHFLLISPYYRPLEEEWNRERKHESSRILVGAMVSWWSRFPREDNSGLIPRKQQTALRSVSIPNLPPCQMLQPVAVCFVDGNQETSNQEYLSSDRRVIFFSRTSDLRPAFFVHCSRILIDGTPTSTSRSTSSSSLGKELR
jgi:hypothetical protein